MELRRLKVVVRKDGDRFLARVEGGGVEFVTSIPPNGHVNPHLAYDLSERGYSKWGGHETIEVVCEGWTPVVTLLTHWGLQRQIDAPCGSDDERTARLCTVSQIAAAA